ncbi:hypothetical protein K2173_002479 [Erythroxylum novogranatense]|uniref:Fe2OG dioxygenase domain-containing protein n=1 Tax=Erythroxylum novogranatense TaxID=1862640 RepID=A0AAV8TA18_9ROSI|nr:hypothetical protein K2173_002479 [Erythroxylum novogranatense]
MGDIDPAFIQDPDYRPTLEPQEPDQIPVINLSISSPNETKNLVSDVGDACQKWGFFQVINHGVSRELRQKMQQVAKEFFHQTSDEKRKVKRDEVHPMGYHDGENTKNVRDWKEVFDYLLLEPTLIPASGEPDSEELRTLTNQWPQYPPEFREVCQEYARVMAELANKIMELISLSLGLPASWFNGYFKDQISFCRLNYYPPCPAPHLALGVGRHKDSSALTILAQDDVGGLEVKQKWDGEWIPVRPTPDAYIINIGDVFQVWSNDRYESVEHRVVVNSKKERFSTPFFFFPSHYVNVKPVNEQHPAKFKEINWGRFFATRNRSDYKKQNVKNIQIDHFRI